LKATATKFIPQCEGIFGTIEALTIDPTYQGVVIIIVIVLDLARVDEEAEQVDIRITFPTKGPSPTFKSARFCST
jgi:hypothetical protein